MMVPEDLRYTEGDVWLSLDGDVARLGVTEQALERLGEIDYVDLPTVGGSLTGDYSFTELEGSEGTEEFASPVTGEVLAVNEELRAAPEALNDDAFGTWIVEVRLEEPAELDELLSAEEYDALLED